MPKKTSLFVSWFLIVVALFAVGSDGGKATIKVKPPKPIYTPDPEYTPSARHDRIQGVVAVNINLDAKEFPTI
jgi:hypothetical protein